MNTKQKIDRANKLRARVSYAMTCDRIFSNDASAISSDVHEISQIEDDLEQRIDNVFRTILQVLKVEQTKTMVIESIVNDYLSVDKNKAIIDLNSRSSKPPKKLKDIISHFDYAIPSEWMDFDDDDKLETAIRKFLDRNPFNSNNTGIRRRHLRGLIS